MHRTFQFSNHGFEIFPFFSPQEFLSVQKFGIEMLRDLFLKHANRVISEKDILSYHMWGEKEKIPHKDIFKAKHRHTQGNGIIKNLLLSSKLTTILGGIGVSNFKIWDEGLGWLAFRLIRPASSDGYPFSCKNWGPAKNVLSVWIPILGFSKDVTINFIPGSHLKQYPKYLPENTHFTKDEYRLDLQPKEEECIRPKLNPGEIILFHPKTLHAEAVEKGVETRFNLEFRIEPL